MHIKMTSSSFDVYRKVEAALEAERAAARQAAVAASTELSELRRHANNEAHRLKARLATTGKKAAEANEEASALAARLQVGHCSTIQTAYFA